MSVEEFSTTFTVGFLVGGLIVSLIWGAFELGRREKK